MYAQITSKRWPVDTDDVFLATGIETRAQRPGSLKKLDEWGISYRPIIPEDATDAVAALVTEGDLKLLWQCLVLSFPEHGLWPVSTSGLYGDVERPWLSEEVDGKQRIRSTAEEFFTSEGNPHGEPSDTDAPVLFQRLAAAVTNGTRHELCPLHVDAGNGLVITPVMRPADVPAAIGWQGPLNYGFTGADISVVLRSWEDRFGAVLMGLDFDSLYVQASATPDDPEELQLLGIEHYIFCPDNIEQGSGTLEAYIPSLHDLSWGFWWD